MRKLFDNGLYKINSDTSQEDLDYFKGKTIDARIFLFGDGDASWSSRTTFEVQKMVRDTNQPSRIVIVDKDGYSDLSYENPIVKILTPESPELI